MIIALFPKTHEAQSKKLAFEVIHFLEKKKIKVVVEDDKAEELAAPPLSSVKAEEIEFLITMGGDGSILRIAHQYAHLDQPILGINLGHLGFMADVQISGITAGLEALLEKKFSVQNRIIIEGTLPDKKSFFSINECVFHRAVNTNLVELAIYVDNLLLNTFEADGMILSTPNGSTAYSLAAGGPILCPDIEAFVLTPISPHTISNRPIVLTSNKEIRIEYVSKNHPIEVVSDGLERFSLKSSESILLKRSQKTFKLVSLDSIDYFSTLRTKLNWSGKLR